MSETGRTYLVQKETFRGAVRWKVYLDLGDGKQCAIGHQDTRRAAVQCARILAGWRGAVRILKPLHS